MPLYEYYCQDCEARFDALRPMSQADEPIACARCHSPHTSRAISLFSALSKSHSGETRSITSGGSCHTCAATTCAGCRH